MLCKQNHGKLLGAKKYSTKTENKYCLQINCPNTWCIQCIVNISEWNVDIRDVVTLIAAEIT